jgi:hypothetical protein
MKMGLVARAMMKVKAMPRDENGDDDDDYAASVITPHLL